MINLPGETLRTHAGHRFKTSMGIGLTMAIAFSSWADSSSTSGLPRSHQEYSVSEMVNESLFGDVYAEPSDWQALSLDNLFSKGWNQPWAGPPAGGGGAPRQGWLNADDGVFYRLGLGIFGYTNQTTNANGYDGTVTLYTPLNQRFEFRTDIPVAASNQSASGNTSQTNFGDFQITPRVILSETRDATHSFDLTFRTPTGNSINGNGVAAIAPTYNFWVNTWKGLVLRGGTGFTIPYSGNIAATGARSTFNLNLAAGYYFTPHDAAPFGDLVVYLATNFTQAIDNRASSSTTTLSLAPGFRTHLGQNWYLLGSVSVPVTYPQPYDYQVQGALMKVW